MRKLMRDMVVLKLGVLTQLILKNKRRHSFSHSAATTNIEHTHDPVESRYKGLDEKRPNF